MFLLSIIGSLSFAAVSPLFTASADSHQLQRIHVDGLANDAVGTVYPAGSLEDGGMPLGGVGTGYICLDTDGRLGKCSIFNRYPAPIAINQPFLSIKWGDKQYALGDAKAVHYFGHFPVADARIEFDAPFVVELRAFSPFIPGDAIESNTPAIVFEISVTNLSPSTQSATATFSPEGFPKGDASAFSDSSWAGVQVAHAPIEKMPDWVRHFYAVAAENGKVDSDSVSSTRELKPAERQTVRFVLAWNQPYLRDGSGRVEKHMYSERFPDAKAVAVRAFEKHAEWLRRILAYQDVIYGADFPDWLKETLINAPYALTKNSLWLASTRPDDWWGKEGLFLVNESFSTCSVCETMPCRFFGHWPALFFFPELELSTLKAIRHFQLRDGEPPFCMGMGFSIRDPRYHCQHTAGSGEYAQMIYRYFLRTGDKARAREFLADFWESARDAIQFMLWLDRDGDGLVEDQPHAFKGETFPANNPLDNWPWHGASSYTAGKGLAALMCGIKMAELAGDTDLARQWRDILAKGQKAYEEKLWTSEYYRTYNDPASGQKNDSCFSAQLSSVWCTRVLGLEDPLPKERIEKSIASVVKLNMPASPYGMVDAVHADGSLCVEGGGSGIPDTCWSRDIFIQCNATAAMAFMYAGKKAEGERAAKTMMDTIFRGPHAMPWAQPCGLSSKTGGTCHGHDYYDHMVVWSYPLAFAGQDIAQACAPGGFVYRLLAASK